MSRRRRLCAAADVPDGNAALVAARGQPAHEAILLVRRGARLSGFVNRCPHMGLPLDWKPDRLALGGGDYLRCSHHGALFRVDDGLCVDGPCVGEHLEVVALQVVRGTVMLAGAPSCRA
jgi:nitrite reductase/ring-hydroxylating ferredoxin subunit